MKKCIIFARCSTLQQFTEGQTDVLKKWAEQCGYPPARQIIIEEQESGIKLKEEERLGINKMKKFIESDPDIDCLFANEVSRIARTKKVLFSVQSYLVEHHIQLMIKEGNIRLLRDNGTVDDGADMQFTIYAQFAESEMRNKKARFAYGKQRCRKNGIWDGTMLPIGYSVDKDNKVITNSDADTVRLIFEEYSTGKWSTTTLANELRERGIKDAEGREFTRSRVANVLTRERYCGEDIYPQIITREIFEKCKELRSNLKVTKKNSFTGKTLCNKLIRCPHCGYHFTSSGPTYRCYNRHELHVCTFNIEISIAVIDSIAWKCASDLEVGDILRNSMDAASALKSELTITETKRDKLLKDIKSAPAKRERIEDMYINGTLSKDAMLHKIKKLDDAYKQLQDSLKAAESDIKTIKKRIASLTARRLTYDEIESLNDSLPEHTEQKKQIIRKHISEIKISEWKYATFETSDSVFKSKLKKKKYMEIVVLDMYGNQRTFRYYPHWGFGTNRIEERET